MDIITEGTPKVAIELIKASNTSGILTVEDLNNEPIHVPSYSVDPERHKILSEIYKNRGWIFTESKLERTQAIRLKICSNDLAIPKGIGTYIALDTALDLNVFPKPESNINDPILVAMAGESAIEKGDKGVGKSILTACLSIRNHWPIISFEPVYEEDAIYYSKLLKNKRWNGENFKDALEIINSTWKEPIKKPIGSVKSLREIFNNSIDLFRSPYRSEVYLCDMPGDPRKINGRPHSVYELFARESCEGQFYTERQLEPEKTMDRKIRWIENNIITNSPKWREESRILTEKLILL